MSLAATTPTALPAIKMEDRKRPAASATEEVAPPPKRQALVNGSKVAEGEEDAWIEKYQKGAIYRQMLEYKRQAQTLEKDLEELQKKTVHHDDHIRTLDAWCQQFVEEIELLAGMLPERPLPSDPPYLTGLLFKDDPETQRHVEFGTAIRDRIESIFKRLASGKSTDDPTTTNLQSTIDRLLASEKSLKLRLDRFEEENAELSTKLNDASYRVVRAEKKMNRLKSTQVQKMEQAAVANATRSAGTGSENGKDEVEVSRNSAELQSRLDEALAVEAKNREQLEALSAELRKLQDENSSLKARREGLADEDFIRTDVYKAFKSQNEELIKKVNHLDAVASQLKEQNADLLSRQTSFQLEVEMAAQKAIQDLEEDIRQKDQDLARIRSARDEILADREMRKVSMEQDTKALEHMAELVSAKDDRIAFLELELSRYRPSEDVKMEDVKSEVDELSVEELREQYQKLLKDHQALSQELPSIEQAYKKFQALAHKKVMDFKAMEDQLGMARAEKSKADQKYFAVRKDTDTRIEQNKVLRMQNAKSSEVIERLKEGESQRRSLITNLEKQMALLKQSNAQLQDEFKKKDGEATEATRRAESYKSQLLELTNLLRSKDAATSLFREQTRTQEEEMERLKVRFDHTQKDRDNWKQKAHANSSEEEELLRKSLSCNVCNQNFKNTVLKTCGHLFCSSCVENRLTSRMRKCPSCSRAFDKMDVMPVHGLGF